MSIAERDTHVRARHESSPAPAGFASDVRSTSLTILAASAAVGLLWWASAVFVPILLSLLISHALEPAVALLERRRIPRSVGVFVVIMSAVAALGYGVYALGEPASTFIDQVPAQAQRLRVELERRARDGSGPLDRVQQAANDLERAATSASKPSPAPSGVQRVRIEEPPFRIGDLAWRGSRGLIEFLAETAVVFFLTYYLMLAGNFYRRKIAGMAGPTLSRKRLVLRIMDDIDRQIKRYLLMRALISLIVAVATGAALAALGMKQAVMWGVVAGVLNVIPYVGPIVAIVGITIAAFAQFDSLATTGLVAGVAALIAFLEGNVLTPKLTGHAGSMNAAAIFTGILFWGWLWGAWGMLLAVPLMTAIKAVCTHIDTLNPIAALLSE